MSNETKDEARLDDSVPSPELEVLRKAAEGLTYPSETDVPFEPFFWKDDSAEPPTAGIVAQHTAYSATQLSPESLDDLFGPLVEEEDWHNDEEREEVRCFKALLETLKSLLKNVNVFRAGETEVEIYIVGCTTGGYAGLKTKAVET